MCEPNIKTEKTNNHIYIYIYINTYVTCSLNVCTLNQQQTLQIFGKSVQDCIHHCYNTDTRHHCTLQISTRERKEKKNPNTHTHKSIIVTISKKKLKTHSKYLKKYISHTQR
jgi:hypothetical protein